MPRLKYHITAGTPRSGHIRIDPNTFYNVGTVQSVMLKAKVTDVLLVNTSEDIDSSVSLEAPGEAAIETDIRALYILGQEGTRVVTDDGA